MDCTEIVDAALSRFRQGFEVSQEDGGCRVLSPFIRRDGDPFELVVHETRGEYNVSDEGDTLEFLQLSGINTRKNTALDRLVAEVASAHRVTITGGSIVAHARDNEEVGDAVARVLAAMNDLSQFELTRRSVPPRTFDALVEGELVGQGVAYENRVKRRGQVREREFRFGINGQRNMVIEPLRALSPSRAVELAAVLIVSVEDVWKVDPNLTAVAVLDDQRDVWSSRALPDLRGNRIGIVRWSNRHDELPAALYSSDA